MSLSPPPPRLTDSNLLTQSKEGLVMAAATTESAQSSSTSVITAAGSNDTSVTQTHKRTYQACIPCRRRKVRCDLGPVDDPHDPPCVRCRRESKECYFSATRRKRKSEGGLDAGEEIGGVDDDYEIRNRRRKTNIVHTSPNTQQHPLQRTQRSITSPSRSRTPSPDGYNSQDHDSQQRPEPYFINPSMGNEDAEQDQEVTNETAAALFQTPINTPGDALHLLLEASGRSEDFQIQNKLDQDNRQSYAYEIKSLLPTSGYRLTRPKSAQSLAAQIHISNLDPTINNDASNNTVGADISQDTLKIWSRLRFVRAGWLTGREAILYMEYFYEYLFPLTPICPPDFLSDSIDASVVDEEPILVVTILTIAARYKKLTGPGGQTRSFMIHERLWAYLQSMITRMFWGQEQFGGGICGAGFRKAAQKGVEKGKLRSFGTIESLLLLSEFHPRSMHFPAGDDGDEIFVPLNGDSDLDEAQGGSAVGESKFAGWTEPALRSDRMCWSLIGTAYTLAYELGIFGNYVDGIRSLEGEIKRISGSIGHRQRADRIERLLYIYITQTSGRLGFPSAFPRYVADTDLVNINKNFFTGERAPSSDLVETIQQSWAEMASFMKASNAALFSSKKQTAELIKNGEYVGRLQQLQPVLASWQTKFQSLDVPKYSKIILSIEYEYARVYINSLALQAVLEPWTTKVGAGIREHDTIQPGASTPVSLAGLYKRNEPYIKEVVDASRSLLRHVVEGLFPSDNLKHAPVRTHMRILSGAMFLLKTFALGAKEYEVINSLRLLDETVKALRSSVVDDVHLCLRIADLLEGLTSSIRHKFVRLARHAGTSQRVNAFSHNHRPQYLSRCTKKTQGAASNDLTPSTVSFSYQYARPNNIEDTQVGSSTDPPDNNISIMPPRDTTYDFSTFTPPTANYNINAPNSASNPFDYQQQHQQQQFYPGTSSISDEDWLTLDLNPLLVDTGTAGLGSGNGTGNDWFGNFGPEITNNLEVLGKLVNEGYRGESWDGSLGFG